MITNDLNVYKLRAKHEWNVRECVKQNETKKMNRENNEENTVKRDEMSQKWEENRRSQTLPIASKADVFRKRENWPGRQEVDQRPQMSWQLNQTGVQSLLEQTFRIVFLRQFLPVLWSSRAQECYYFAGISLLDVATFRAIALNGIWQKLWNDKNEKQLKK